MSDARIDRERSRAANRSPWDAWTAVHEHAPIYGLVGSREGGIRPADHELGELGPVEGLSLLHLQCHFGMRCHDGRYRLPPDVAGQLPLFFSRLAAKPA